MADGTNWVLVNDGNTDDPEYYDHKAIAIASNHFKWLIMNKNIKDDYY